LFVFIEPIRIISGQIIILALKLQLGIGILLM